MCPKCRKGYILKGKTAYGCSEYKSGCDLRLSFDEYPSELTPAKLSKQIKKNYNG
jgi:DNA topoisomerase-3